jgi:rare lipoprotein A (peptidoglycan hydrolase)
MRRAKGDLTQSRLKECLHYDPATGVFTRLRTVGAAKAGTPVTYSLKRGGYIAVWIDGFLYTAHRLAWLYMTGVWPSHEIDHKDRVPTNNAFANLREVTSQQNQQNRGIQSNNTSGVAGVAWCKNTKRWRALIVVNNKNVWLGRHPDFESAVAVRRAAERKYFGEFAAAIFALAMFCLPSVALAESCTASWYGVGDGYGGKRTASGEIMRPSAMTAAHKTLPFGTRVRVVSGIRSVVVRINDRGPHVRGRCVDLSHGAARALGMGGTARVTVERM